MQFHHHGYVSGDPRVQPAAGTGIDRPEDLPDEVDVLIVGAGPAGLTLAAQLAHYPDLVVRVVERRTGRLAIGQADGIQARSVETFQAFGFAERITQEAYRIAAMNFWSPSPEDPGSIARSARTLDDEHGISEFPHLIVNQARVLDYFAEAAANAPARIVPDYGYEFVGLTPGDGGPVTVTLRRTEGTGGERVVRAAYVVGGDGARSRVRESIGLELKGQAAMHAWGVMDTLAVTDFPDWRTKCAISSASGSILLIPREGGQLVRLYVDLGETTDEGGDVRATPLQDIVARARAILHPYSLDVRDVPWWSVYEVGHRLTDAFDDVPAEAPRAPRVFIAGDACHTHSAKAGQGMNVSIQDGWNLSWKLGQVLTGRSPAALLSTYSAERQVIAQNLIDFDREWSTLMAKKPEEFSSPEELGRFYVETAEFPAGFRTQYEPSMITSEATHQDLASGYPVGKRFTSARAMRVADALPVHLGHHHRADGRWRLYAFADAAPAGSDSPLARWARWLAAGPDSPVVRFTRADEDLDGFFDVKAVYQQPHGEVDFPSTPELFRPASGPLGLRDYEKVYAADPADDIFEARGISREGAVVVVRPDQYVAAVLPLSARAELRAFFEGFLLPAR